MKYLKKYDIFLEDGFDVQPTDLPNIKKSKEQLTKVKGDIDDFNKKKSQIDTIYKTAKDDKEIDSKISNLLGADPKTRNPYIVNYLTAAEKQRELDKIIDNRVNNKSNMDEYKDLMQQAKDDNTKKIAQSKIDELSKKMKDDEKKIKDLKDESYKRKKQIDTTSNNNLKEIEDDVKNITTKT